MTEAAPIELAGMFLEWQRIEDAKADLADQSKALFKAAKDKGYDTKAMRAVFREKRVELEASPEDAAKAEEAEAMNDLYRSALDRGLTARARPAHDAREEDISYAQLKIRDAQALASENEREPVDWDEISCRELPDDSPVKVYFIAAPSLGLIKIGSTGAVERRISAIQRGVPVPTALIGVIAGGAKREVELHKKYAAHRVHGEWFSEVIRPELELLLTDQTVIEEFPAENLSYSQSGLTYANEKGRGAGERLIDAAREMRGMVGELTDTQESDQPDEADVPATAAVASDEQAAQDDVGATASSTYSPETANEVPAQDGGGTALDASHGGKSNAARPASVDAHVNGGRLAGEVSAEAVTVVGDESGTLTNSHSQASSSQPANSVGEAPSSSPASPARHSDDIDLTIPAFLRRDEGRDYPKREAEAV